MFQESATPDAQGGDQPARHSVFLRAYGDPLRRSSIAPQRLADAMAVALGVPVGIEWLDDENATSVLVGVGSDGKGEVAVGALLAMTAENVLHLAEVDSERGGLPGSLVESYAAIAAERSLQLSTELLRLREEHAKLPESEKAALRRYARQAEEYAQYRQRRLIRAADRLAKFAYALRRRPM